MYNSLYTKEKKIHTLVAFPLLLLVVVAIFFVFKKPESRKQQPEAKSKVDIDLQVTNVTSTGATVCWKSEESATGEVVFGETESTIQTHAYDERDLPDNLQERNMHCVPIKGLSPNSKYYFKVVSGGSVVKNTYLFSTAPKYGLAKNVNPVICKVYSQKGSPIEDGVVIVEVEGAFPVSAYIKPTGECLVGLSNVLSKKDLTLLNVTPDTKVRVIAYDSSAAFTVANTTIEYASALPPMVVGKKYTVDAATVDSRESVLGAAQSQSEPNITSTPASASGKEEQQDEISIYSPEPGAKIAGSTPIFRGQLKTKKRVQIDIEDSRAGLSTVGVDEQGIFKYAPSVGLSQGDHSVTFTVRDGKKIYAQTSRSFTILKSGLGVLGTATSEATLTPTEAPTPTEEPSSEPTVVPTSPPLTPTPPVSGVNIIPFSYASAALLLIGAGILIIF